MKGPVVACAIVLAVLASAPASAQSFTVEVTVPAPASRGPGSAPSLPRTGLDLFPLLAVAGILVVAGLLLLSVGTRMRRTTP